MDNKSSVLIFVIFSWLMTFGLLVVASLQGNCFLNDDSYQRDLLIAAFINLACVVIFITFAIYEGGE